MGIETIIAMIPKGGKYAKSVVNFVHKVPQNWEKFKSAIQQIDDILKQGKLKLDGKQKTIFETNKNILKTHEKVTKKASDDLVKWFEETTGSSPKKPEDYFKGWTPNVITGGKGRNVPPARLYTKEMERIDEELDALVFGDKYNKFSDAEKAALFKQLQANMKKLIDKAMKDDLATLSLGEINKKSHALQKRIREIANNPNIEGTVYSGPKRDMIKVIAEEREPLDKARLMITKRNSELKYGKKYPVLDPENDAFIVLGLDERGNPIKISRFTGKFSATKDSKTGELTSSEGTSWWDTWDPKKNQMREQGKEVFHETMDSKGKVIMSNPNYKIPKTQNREIWNELYSDVSTSDLAKKGFKLKDIDMLVKGRLARKYLEKTVNPDHNIATHEQTSTSAIGDVMEDLYFKGDDIYKMSIEEWIKKIPQYFAEGGYVPGFATGGVSNLFRQRQGYRSGETVIKLAKGARWLLRMLKEMSDDMIFGHGKFANMAESLKMKYFKQTEAAIKSLEAGGPIPDEILTSLRQDPRFKNLTVSKGGDKDFIEMQEVVLGKKGMDIYKKFQTAVAEGTGEKLSKGKSYSGVVEELKPLKTEKGYDDIVIDLMAFKKELPADIIANLEKLPMENQTILLTQMKKAFDMAKKGGVESGTEVLQKQLLEDFIPKGKPHATGGRIGFRSGKAVEVVTQLPEFLKFVDGLLIKASNQIRQGLGKWKGLADKEKWIQHDNLTKLVTEFQKTKKFDPKMNEYFGIDAEKAFIEAQAKVAPVKKTRTMDDLVEQAYDEIAGGSGFSGDLKYDADILASEIATVGGKIYDDLVGFQKAGIYDLAYKRMAKNLKAKMDFKKNLKDLEQKIELQMFDPKGKTKHATGGLIDGYATGGVSNLFRRR
jgi:hypothetical protein